MSVYGITGVQLDTQGSVVRASICQIDPSVPRWVGEAKVLEGSDLASLVVKGELLYAIVATEGLNALGPLFKHKVFAGGKETVELAEDIPGRRLSDLVQM